MAKPIIPFGMERGCPVTEFSINRGVVESSQITTPDNHCPSHSQTFFSRGRIFGQVQGARSRGGREDG